MRIPSAIDKNTLKAYEPHPRVTLGDNQTLKSYNLEEWDQHLPKHLYELCLESIAKNWAEKQILDEIVLARDRYLLLDILDTNLPLGITIPKIPDDVYWRKCYLEKWPNQLPENVKPVDLTEIFRDNDIRKLSSVYSANGSNVGEIDSNRNGSSRRSSQVSQKSRKRSTSSISGIEENYSKRSWKERYIEKHIKEYLEHLKPENYDAEKIKELSDLCSSYVRVLRIDQLQSSENSPNRIPLNSILSGFRHLTELSLCFKQTYIGEEFSWNVVNTAFQDIKLLSKGLEKLRLHTLRIRNSDINGEKVILILKALLRHELKILDFLHCKIDDRGTLAISKFILEVPVKEVNLGNNRLGPKGVEYLCYALRQPSCEITNLDLHLNQLTDSAGNLLLTTIIPSNLKVLHLGGCGLSESLSVGRLLQTNNSLESLDISNNNLGENIGQSILESLKFNYTIKKLDLRMCKIPSDIEFEIQELVNAKTKRKPDPLTLDELEALRNLSVDISNGEKIKEELELILQ